MVLVEVNTYHCDQEPLAAQVRPDIQCFVYAGFNLLKLLLELESLFAFTVARQKFAQEVKSGAVEKLIHA